MSNKKVIAYIDGFNLYKGMVEEFGPKYKWLDIPKLLSLDKFLQKDQTLIEVKYFTTIVNNTRTDK